MKKILLFAAIVLTISFISSPMVFALNQSPIEIDGSMDDWDNKPYIEDPKHDIKSPWLDFETVKYMADDKYLYLYVDRLSANKSEPWHFNVIFLDGTKGEKHMVFPFGQEQPVYAPIYDITLSYDDSRNSDGALVTVSIDGNDIESTYSSMDHGKTIEFRVPLEPVGLDSVNKEIRFMLASDIDDKNGEIDWVPDGEPITVTTGSTFWQLSTAVFLIAVSASVYGVYKHKRIKS